MLGWGQRLQPPREACRADQMKPQLDTKGRERPSLAVTWSASFQMRSMHECWHLNQQHIHQTGINIPERAGG